MFLCCSAPGTETKWDHSNTSNEIPFYKSMVFQNNNSYDSNILKSNTKAIAIIMFW